MDSHVDFLDLEQRAIPLRLRAFKRPLDVRNQWLLRSPLAGDEERVVTKQRREALKRLRLGFRSSHAKLLR